MEMNATPSYHINTTGVFRNNVSLYNDSYAELRPLHIMSLICYSLLFVLGVLGNGVVIWVTGFKMKKTVNTVWFLNLAVADFIFTAFLSLSVTSGALGFHWPFGKFMCKLSGSSFLNMYASIYILMVISLDRCVSVLWPVWTKNHRSVRMASCVSLGVWVLGLILSIPNIVFRDTYVLLNNNKDIIICYDILAMSDAMIITHFLLGFVVPFTVIVSCYAVIIHRIRGNRTLASHSSRPFKIITAVITTFFLCWAPIHIMTLIEVLNFQIYKNETVTVITIYISVGLAYLNSCLNPLLYVFMGQDFKDRVHTFNMKVFESAFKEEVAGSHSGTRPMDTSESKEMSALTTEV